MKEGVRRSNPHAGMTYTESYHEGQPEPPNRTRNSVWRILIAAASSTHTFFLSSCQYGGKGPHHQGNTDGRRPNYRKLKIYPFLCLTRDLAFGRPAGPARDLHPLSPIWQLHQARIVITPLPLRTRVEGNLTEMSST